MSKWQVLPHQDPTLGGDDAQVIDHERSFIDRVLKAEPPLPVGEVSPDQARAALIQRSARSVLSKNPAGSHAHLRALGALLAAHSAHDPGLRLRLDDLELVGGTTERSLDLLRTTDQPPVLFAPELERAIAQAKDDGVARLWLSADQQLPSLFWLARALPESVRLELGGPFAQLHQAALLAVPALRRATVIKEELPFYVSHKGEKLVWRSHPNTPASMGPHAGYYALLALRDPDKLLLTDAKTIVVGVVEVTDDEALGADGERQQLSLLQKSFETLAREGVTVVAEWWVGAPRVDRERVEKTLPKLLAAPFFHWLCGVRVFHWGVERRGIQFDSLGLTLKPDPERDLARTVKFEAEGTIAPFDALALAEKLSLEVAKVWPLTPGRVAGALVEVPSRAPVGTGLFALDPDCAVVELPFSLDGKPSPSAYAQNLRTGTALSLDGRLLPSLRAWTTPRSASDGLSGVPEPQRVKLCQALCQKGVLSEVSA